MPAESLMGKSTMLDPFKKALVATARANQQVVHLKVDQALAGAVSASSSQRDGLAPVLDLPQPEGAFGSAAK